MHVVLLQRVEHHDQDLIRETVFEHALVPAVETMRTSMRPRTDETYPGNKLSNFDLELTVPRSRHIKGAHDILRGQRGVQTRVDSPL